MKEQRVLSVKELTKYIKLKLESDAVLSDVWVKGEISNFTRHSSGHMYFTLKDDGSRVKSIMFASYNQKLAFSPKEGTMVIARGNISVFDRDGQYQFYVQHMQPDGIGSLYLAFEQLKQKLEKEGLFAEERKRSLPRYPLTIGVITSPTGAAVRDIIMTLQRRYPTASILLDPVLVQGTQAAASVAAAIDRMNRHGIADVLIVGRGGGSLEELWSFNEEVVARAIYDSRIPVISAVGHETDFTIADFVADLRAATPTAAAELSVPHHMELRQQIASYGARLTYGISSIVKRRREKLQLLSKSPYLLDPRRQLIHPSQRLDRLKDQLVYRMRGRLQRSTDYAAKLEKALLRQHPREQIQAASNRTDRARLKLIQAMNNRNRDSKHRLGVAIRQLDALSPLKIMQRGYSLIYDAKGKKLINSLDQVQLGDPITIRVTDGRLECQVWSMQREENSNDGTRA
jgi:exodeoxyribonuclease VII large subunit